MTRDKKPPLYIKLRDSHPHFYAPYQWLLMTAGGTVVAFSTPYLRRGDRNRRAQFVADELGLTIERGKELV